MCLVALSSTTIVASDSQDTDAAGNPLKSTVESRGRVAITEKTNNKTGFDSVELLMAESTNKLLPVCTL